MNQATPDLSRLSGSQIVAVLAAAQQLHMRARAPFLDYIAMTLADKPEIGDGDVLQGD